MNAIMSVHTPIGVLSVRNALAEDAIAYSNYWLNSSTDYLAQIGVNVERLGNKESIEARFLTMIGRDTQQAKVVYSITLNDHLIGYTNLNRYDDLTVGYGHIHSYFTELKKAMRLSNRKAGSAFHTQMGSILVGQAILSAFKTTNVNKIITQTRVSNVKINRAVDYYMPVSENKYLAQPDGLSHPGQFNLRYFLRDNLHNIQAKLNNLAS